MRGIVVSFHIHRETLEKIDKICSERKKKLKERSGRDEEYGRGRLIDEIISREASNGKL
jgi:hypothetical protein